MQLPKIDELVRRDPRYPQEAYEFVFAALKHTQQLLAQASANENTGREDQHVSGAQLAIGAKDLALREFGLMAPLVFRMWGVQNTVDFGQIVFNLIEVKLMSKSDRDTLDSFRDLYPIDESMTSDYRIELPREAEELS